eukprot:scaffold141488_cov19-Tisochrysis_lutea.AAC.1
MQALKGQLNESQLHALQLAFTQRVAMIQGPPGKKRSEDASKACQLPHWRRHWQNLHRGATGGCTASAQQPHSPGRVLYQSRIRPGDQYWILAVSDQ